MHAYWIASGIMLATWFFATWALTKTPYISFWRGWIVGTQHASAIGVFFFAVLAGMARTQ